MSCRPYLSIVFRLIAAALPLTAMQPAQAVTQIPEIAETDEIVFNPVTNLYAQQLHDKAAQLGSSVAIYEYVRNNFEYTAYHGSRSGSIDTFNGNRGSDVDIATAMIAMLRSQSIPARYAVGTIKLPVAQLGNWLGIGNSSNVNVAIQVLQDQGIQGISLSTDGKTVSMEHVWVEALVPFAQYRGITTGTSVDCTAAANAPQCNWIPLDGSFKQLAYNGLNIDPYNVSSLNFDYNAFYNAIAANDPQRLNKNPLTILEEQIATWLRTTYPGKTLDDVADVGQIIQINDGLLPASLPYTVTSSIRRYDSVALHDAQVPAAEPKVWAKYLTITATIPPTTAHTGLQGQTPPLLLAQLNTQRLTIDAELSGTNAIVKLRWGGNPSTDNTLLQLIWNSIAGYNANYGDPLTIDVQMDGAPDYTGGSNDSTISATYNNAVVGGTYLIATGGEASNWQQVHNAAGQLLYNDTQYNIVFNPAQTGSYGQSCTAANSLGCTPYVHAGAGGYVSTDLALWQNPLALNNMTGGLLYVAAMQYFANLRDMYDRADHLMKTKTPIIGFLGVVSSNYSAEYVGNDSFSIIPDGLLIDMKGVKLGGSYRINDVPLAYSNREFEFIGHIGSSLEHETWQELTGYDAVSTVRGIQMAIANGASLVNPVKNSTQDTLPGLYSSFLGYNTSGPVGFTYQPFVINGKGLATWSSSTVGAQFQTFLQTVNAATDQNHLNYWTYNYDGSDVFSGARNPYAFASCTASRISSVNGLSSLYTYTWSTCDGAALSGYPSQMLSQINTDWTNTLVPNYIGQAYNSVFSYNNSTGPNFAPSAWVYTTLPANPNQYSIISVASIRDDLYAPPTVVYSPTSSVPAWVSYTLPSSLVQTANNRFEVDIRRIYASDTGWLSAVSFEINNLGK